GPCRRRRGHGTCLGRGSAGATLTHPRAPKGNPGFEPRNPSFVLRCRRAWPGCSRHYRAVLCSELKQPLAIEEVAPRPVGPHEVRVDVHFSGVKFADILVCRGQYQEKPRLPFIPGVEFSGIVLETGRDVHTVKEGDRVIGLRRLNCMAGECIIDHKALWQIPEGISFREAAVLPASYNTAILALEHRARTQPGLAWEGRIVVVGFAGGTIASVPANLLLLKNISAMGIFGVRYQGQNFPVFSRALSSAIQYCLEGRIHPYIGAVFKLEEVNDAFLYVINRTSMGKVLLSLK
uniref:Enoyl reductase (ER) domain-containing protein n=1 Tax=Sus scrofa TaxID=9823 RepID=A0A8D0Q8Y8_PIG